MKIAIIAPSDLPIPDVKGGAIETLTMHLIRQNEIRRNLDLMILSPYDLLAKKVAEEIMYSKFFFINSKRKLGDKLVGPFWSLLFYLSGRKILPPSEFANKCIHILKANAPDIILIEGSFSQVLTLKKIGIPIVLHLHTDILNKNTPYCSLVANNCSRIWVISEFLKKRIIEGSGTNIPIDIFKNAIDIAKFSNISRDSRLRNSLGIPVSNKVLLYCGRLVPIKGVKELLLAYNNSSTSNTSLLVVGGSNFADSKPTEYEQQLFDIASKSNKQVIFAGYKPQKELPAYYSIADAFACPSICNEAAGLVIIEARSNHLPVIASNMGGIPEYINSDSTILAENNERFVDNLTNAIDRMLTDEDMLTIFKQAANEVLDDMSIEVYYKNFVELLNKI